MDYGTMLRDAYMRYAGETPLPEGLDRLRDLLLRGRISDEQGNSITITPQGGFEVKPVNSGFSIRGSAGADPSIGINYQSRKPEFTGRSAEFAVDEALKSLMQSY